MQVLASWTDLSPSLREVKMIAPGDDAVRQAGVGGGLAEFGLGPIPVRVSWCDHLLEV